MSGGGGGHWYKQDGSPCHTIQRSDGKGERNTDLRDAKKHQLVPSVSGIIGVTSKQGLERWKRGKLAEACASTPFNDEVYSTVNGEKVLRDAYKKWSSARDKEAQQETEEAANIGKLVHANLERLFKGERIVTDPYSIHAELAYSEILQKFPSYDFIPEREFAYDGYGGTCDLHHPRVVLDFKTKNTDDIKKMVARDEHAMQLAAYKAGLDLPQAKCYNLFISTQKKNLFVWKEWTEKEIERAHSMFKLLKEYWYLSNNYRRG